MHQNDSDSDSSDSDYDPNVANSVIESTNNCDRENDNYTLKDISYTRKRKANLLWDEMNAIDKKELEEKLMRVKKIKPSTTIKRSTCKKAKLILDGIFGKSQSAVILQKVSSISNSTDDISSVSIKEAIKKTIKSLPKIQKVNETRKFAGQNIT